MRRDIAGLPGLITGVDFSLPGAGQFGLGSTDRSHVTIVAFIVVGFAVHFLFSPWLLVAVAVVAWIKFRPRRSQR